MNNKSRHGKTRFFFCSIPIIVACVLVFFFRSSISRISIDSFLNIVEIVIGLEGTMLGFIITAVSILVAFSGSKLTEEVKETGHFRTVLFMYLFTCFELLLAIILCVYILLFNSTSLFYVNLFMIMLIVSVFYILLCLFFLCLIVYTLFH